MSPERRRWWLGVGASDVRAQEVFFAQMPPEAVDYLRREWQTLAAFQRRVGLFSAGVLAINLAGLLWKLSRLVDWSDWLALGIFILGLISMAAVQVRQWPSWYYARRLAQGPGPRDLVHDV